MQVADEPLEDVLEARIRGLGIDADSVFGDVVDGEVFHGRKVGYGRFHNDNDKLVHTERTASGRMERRCRGFEDRRLVGSRHRVTINDEEHGTLELCEVEGRSNGLISLVKKDERKNIESLTEVLLNNIVHFEDRKPSRSKIKCHVTAA